MYKFLSKYGQQLAFGLGLVIAAIFIFSVFSGFDAYDALAEDEKASTGIFNIGIYAAIALIIVAALSAVVAGLFHMLTDLKGSVKFLLGLGLVAIVFFIWYSISNVAGTDAIQTLLLENEISDNVSKMISAGLWTVITFSGLCLLAIILGEGRSMAI